WIPAFAGMTVQMFVAVRFEDYRTDCLGFTFCILHSAFFIKDRRSGEIPAGFPPSREGQCRCSRQFRIEDYRTD
ncbi:MAG: hypothetical protein V2A61_02670, partial [Calditrichota bacterium]